MSLTRRQLLSGLLAGLVIKVMPPGVLPPETAIVETGVDLAAGPDKTAVCYNYAGMFHDTNVIYVHPEAYAELMRRYGF